MTLMAFTHNDPETGRRNTFHMHGTDQEIWEALCNANREIAQVQQRIGFHVPHAKRAIAPYQAAALYALAKPYGTPEGDLGGRVLEIGTFIGYSAAWLASALPAKRIVTLNPLEHERSHAMHNLRTWPKVQVRPELSWDYLTEHDKVGSPRYDLIFIDGDHKHVRADLPWLTFLNPGGLLLFHDYSPADSARPCPPVFDAVNELAAYLRPETSQPDVTIIDQHNVGLGGFYKRPGDHLEPHHPIVVKDHPITRAAQERAAAEAAAGAAPEVLDLPGTNHPPSA